MPLPPFFGFCICKTVVALKEPGCLRLQAGLWWDWCVSGTALARIPAVAPECLQCRHFLLWGVQCPPNTLASSSSLNLFRAVRAYEDRSEGCSQVLNLEWSTGGVIGHWGERENQRECSGCHVGITWVTLSTVTAVYAVCVLFLYRMGKECRTCDLYPCEICRTFLGVILCDPLSVPLICGYVHSLSEMKT